MTDEVKSVGPSSTGEATQQAEDPTLVRKLQTIKQAPTDQERNPHSDTPIAPVDLNSLPKRDGPKWTDIAIVILTAGIVLAAILQTLIFNRQWKEMHDAGAQTDRIIRAAQQVESDLTTANTQNLHQFENTLTESQRALTATIDQSRLEQRAFVNFSKTIQNNPALLPGQKTIEQWEFRPVIGNSGNTPTRNAIMHASFSYRLGELPGNFTFPDLGPPTPNTPFVLGPKEQDVTGPLFSIPVPILRAVRSRALHLYFWGWLTYRDVFPGTAKHVSMFCTEMAFVRGDLSPETSYQFGWTLCPRHNCTDDDCKGEPYGSPTKFWPN